eukprot:5004614-Pleurochrysis_carterae.AAC.2
MDEARQPVTEPAVKKLDTSVPSASVTRAVPQLPDTATAEPKMYKRGGRERECVSGCVEEEC